MGPRNSNFDPAFRTGWNQCHCEDYQILSPTTIHGSKSKLEQPRYHENRVNASIDAPLTSRSQNFWSDHWIFKLHTFLETRSQDLSRGVEINLIRDLVKVAALQGPSPRKAFRGYKRPQAPLDQKKKGRLSWVPALCLDEFWTFLLSSKHKKTHQSLLILFFTKKIQGSVHTLHLPLLSSIPWIWGLRVVDVAF